MKIFLAKSKLVFEAHVRAHENRSTLENVVFRVYLL
jgi:hypothetical protein